MTDDPNLEQDYVRGRVMVLESFCRIFFMALYPEPSQRDLAREQFKLAMEIMQRQKLSPSFRRGMEDGFIALTGEVEDTDRSPCGP